ncbi:MAG: heme ABC transporter permease [Betaproteobacteria bacterium]|nr:heme ABC transporter permease [Betaproteobacteria bacterium]NDF70373.1 heme ABC transporter permease [Betaproteobacteria bacterium]
MLTFLKQLGSPPVFFRLSGPAAVWLARAASLLAIPGLWLALAGTPTDAQQGEVYRIIYLHVPAAWMSMFLYSVATGYAVLFWIWRSPVSAVMMRALLPTGAWMTVVALVTGSLWGKPTWGTYWVWDARLTSELMLLFIYLGLMALSSLVEDEHKTDRALALFTVVGMVNIPLIYFSVVFWNTLHQGMSIGAPGAARMAPEMKITLLICTFAVWFACAAIVLVRGRWLLALREARAKWVREV